VADAPVVIVSLLWLVALNGTLALNLRGGLKNRPHCVRADDGAAVPMAPIVLLPDSIFRERQSGTAAWVLTSRSRGRPPAGQVAAHAVGFLLTSVVVPGAVAYFQLQASGELQLPLLTYAALLGSPTQPRVLPHPLR